MKEANSSSCPLEERVCFTYSEGVSMQLSPKEILHIVSNEVEEFFGGQHGQDPSDPDVAVCLARCANRMAKFTGNYSLKVLAFTAASLLPGVTSGWGDDGCYFIQGPCMETSAHDPFEELKDFLEEVAPNLKNSWVPFEWDGKICQPWAWEILLGLPLRKKRRGSRPVYSKK